MKISFITDKVLEIEGDTLVGADLDGLDFHRALLEKMDMTASRARGANFRGAFLSEAILNQCDLTGSNLITAFLMKTSLQSAVLVDVLAIGCNFQSADLRKANLNKMNGNGASFDHCQLEGAIMTLSDLEGATFVDATYNDLTIWPDGFSPSSQGAIRKDLVE